MLRPRLIPCLLIHQGGLVKTKKFQSPKYVGDPINAVKIFNEKNADELVIFDIDATVNGVEPNFRMIAKLAAECRMPLCYGGGIKTADQAARIIDLGVEKISISSAAIANPALIGDIAAKIGRQSVVVTIDVRKRHGLFSNGYDICTHNAHKAQRYDPVALAIQLQEAGAGEVIFNSVDQDGEMRGYDLEFAKQAHNALRIPTTFLGGAGSLKDIIELINSLGLVGAAAGSLFVFKGNYRAVLISYPTLEQKNSFTITSVK